MGSGTPLSYLYFEYSISRITEHNEVVVEKRLVSERIISENLFEFHFNFKTYHMSRSIFILTIYFINNCCLQYYWNSPFKLKINQ